MDQAEQLGIEVRPPVCVRPSREQRNGGRDPTFGELASELPRPLGDFPSIWRVQVVQFLKDLERLLDFVTKNPEGLVPEELHGFLGPAWEVVQPRFEPAIAGLQQVSDVELEAAGLTGAELAMKLGGVEWAYRMFRRARQAGARFVPAALSTVLGLSDVIADSIPVISQLVHPIGEYKSFVEKSADAVDFVVR
jgi:hypothetical protein